MLPVKNDFTGYAVKKFYRFLPVMTSKNSQHYPEHLTDITCERPPTVPAVSPSVVLVIAALWPPPPSAEAFGIDANLSYPDFTIELPFVDR